MIDIIYEDLKAKVELLNIKKEELQEDLQEELQSLNLTNFTYNKRVKEITEELKEIDNNLTKANKNLISYMKEKNIVED
jgi:chaperonin cofactor prefoldin